MTILVLQVVVYASARKTGKPGIENADIENAKLGIVLMFLAIGLAKYATFITFKYDLMIKEDIESSKNWVSWAIVAVVITCVITAWMFSVLI